MKILTISVMLTGHLLLSTAQAKENCDKALDAIPRHQVSKMMFKEIFLFKQEYSHCLDGAIAEGIAGVIVDSLDRNWSQLEEITELNKKDSSFKKFLLGLIEPNVTGQETEVKSIIHHAGKMCPKKMKAFCKELIQVCKISLTSEK